MSAETCAACGQGGYWVAYDPQTEEQRCVNHIGFDTWPTLTSAPDSWGYELAPEPTVQESGCSYCGRDEAVSIGVDDDGDHICADCAKPKGAES
jgi:hypothetical protein